MPGGAPLKVIVKSPYSRYSGYGMDGFGLIRALHEWGCDVYPQPTWLDVPIPRDLLPLFAKTLHAPFDLLINHWDPDHLEITREAREASRVAVAWGMWEFTPAPESIKRPCKEHRPCRRCGRQRRDHQAEAHMYYPTDRHPEAVGEPGCSRCRHVPSGLWPHAEQKSTLRERLKWYDMVLGYDEVSLSSFDYFIPLKVHKGILQGGYESRLWKPIDRDWHGDRFQFAQPLDARVLTPQGWRRMGELAVGDELVNPDGGVQVVTRVWERGEQEAFRVTMTDGSQAECSADHLWRVKGHVRKDWEVLPLREIAASLRDRKAYRWELPQPVLSMPHSIVPLDPYLLGLLLGDGSMPKRRGDPARFYSADLELVGACRERLPAGMELRFIRAVGACESYDLVMERSEAGVCKLAGASSCSPTGEVVARGLCATHWAAEQRGNRLHNWPPRGKNEVAEALAGLQLAGVSGLEKFIPRAYLEGSAAQRLEILRGLMDTDGTAGGLGSASFTSGSRQLAEDVQYLVRSLGGYAHRHTRVNSSGRLIHIISVITDVCPFRLARKVRAWKSKASQVQRRKKRRVATVEAVGRTAMRCITVSGESGTYVTDDLIVTHNCMHGALNDRKAPWTTIQAWHKLKAEKGEAFAPARLALHTSLPGTLFPELNGPFEHVGARVFCDALDTDDVKNLYAASHCLLAPSHGEGKNLPALEFLSTGGAVAATNFGGHRQWLSGDWAYPLDYTLAPTFGDCPWGAHWANVSVDHLAEVIWHIYTHRDEARQKALRGQEMIPKLCDWSVVVENLFRRIRDQVKGPGPQVYDAAMACRRTAEAEPSLLLG
jgi:LAGLIDADG-like domain